MASSYSSGYNTDLGTTEGKAIFLGTRSSEKPRALLAPPLNYMTQGKLLPLSESIPTSLPMSGKGRVG